MLRDRIKKILEQGSEGAAVNVCGWVKSKRVSKTFSFVVINDGSCQSDLQVVIDSQCKGYDQVDLCGTGSAVAIEGIIKKSQGSGQAWEVHGTQLKTYGAADASYPLQKKGHSLEFLREIAHLRPRTNTFGAIFRIRNVLSFAVHEFFQKRGFYWVHTPILTASDCEGAGEMFQVTTLDLKNPPKRKDGAVDFSKDFFGQKAHLTVSGQLEGEFLALSLGQIYTFGPTFRAENSNTTRHLAEFWMIEPEVAFAELRDVMALAEDFVKFLCAAVIKNCPDELSFLNKHYPSQSLEQLQRLVESPFVAISYSEAIQLLTEAQSKGTVKFDYHIEWGKDMQSEHERYLCEVIYKGPVIVTDYPKDIKAFYMKLNSDNRTVAAMDLLVPGVGELIGGSQREDNEERLLQRMQHYGIQKESLDWYLQLRRWGSCPHGGFGLGFERLVQYLTGMGNIRDTLPCPRTPGSIAF